jgi:hypothetical protein
VVDVLVTEDDDDLSRLSNLDEEALKASMQRQSSRFGWWSEVVPPEYGRINAGVGAYARAWTAWHSRIARWQMAWVASATPREP